MRMGDAKEGSGTSLHSAAQKRKEESEDDFMKDFERDMLLGDETEESGGAENDLFFDSLDGIVNSVKEEMQSEKDDGDFGMGDAQTDFFGMDPLEALVNEVSSVKGAEEEGSLVDKDQDLLDLLRSEEGLSDIGDLLSEEEDDETFNDTVFQNFADVEMKEQTQGEGEPGSDSFGRDSFGGDFFGEGTDSEENGKKPKKPGFFARLKKLLFGEDEEEALEENQGKISISDDDMGDGSDDGFAIFHASDDDEEIEAPLSPEEEKARKKEEKKAAKAKKKEEREKKKKEKKEQKAKQPKKVKPKKVKPPKEKDNTPPLPKIPVLLVFVMAGSFFALIMVATNLLGYSNSFTEAKDAYSRGNYELAYRQVEGMKIKEADFEEYEKYRIAATVSEEYSAYESLMEGQLYDMALDSLIRTLGRCGKYYPDAEIYGCAGVLDDLKAETVNALSVFGISEEEAMALYDTRDRKEYSGEIYRILKAAGLEKVEEK